MSKRKQSPARGWSKAARAEWRSVRRFVSLGYDESSPLSAAKRKTIRRYAEEARKLQLRGVHIYRPKKSERLRPAQAAAQMDPSFRAFTVSFLPVPPSGRIRIRWTKKGELRLRVGNVTRTVHYFSDYADDWPFDFFDDPEAIIQRILDADKKSIRFVLLAGAYEEKGGFPRNAKLIADVIFKRMNKYANVQEFLHGLVGYRFPWQADWNEYRESRGISDPSKRKKRRAKDWER